MIESRMLSAGQGAARRDVAVEHRPGSAPGLFWLSGFRSDMAGAKAMAVDAFGAREGLAVTRFDYSAHGRSGGEFLEGTVSRWLEEALAVFATTSGPQIVIGSSMGGWIALLLALALRRTGDERVQGLVLVAPAVDFTQDLVLAGFSPETRAELHRAGLVLMPSEYGDPYPFTLKLIEDGETHRLFGRPIVTGCPVTILQGGRDHTVPVAHAQKLVTHLISDPVTLTLVPDGDHRLSRPEDLELLQRAIRYLIEDLEPIPGG